MSAPIHADGLVKRYGATDAVAGVSLDVAPGELFGVIGPDGAGKTTLFRMLVTAVVPDAGTATVDGLDVVADHREIRRRVGYMPGRFSLYPDLTVRENLAFFASVFGTTVEAGAALIAPIYTPLAPFAGRRAGALSGGMKQKLALSCALVHRPRVLVLDEPTTGVAPVSRVEFWDLLAALRADGLTTIVSTSYMDEAARCDRIALMQGGRLLGPPAPPADVAASVQAPLVRVVAGGPRAALLARLRAAPGVARAEVFGAAVHVTGPPDAESEAFAETLRRALAGLPGAHAEPVAPGVEDAFMHLMGTADDA